MKRYIKEIRYDECKKLIYIIPGFFYAILITHGTIDITLIIKTLLGILSVLLISFASDLINDYFDRKYDKYHPIKRDRFFVVEKIDKTKVFWVSFILLSIGVLLSLLISINVFILVFIYAFCNVLYQSHLLHLKDILIVDLLIEALDIPLIFLIGWFLTDIKFFPLIILVIAIFMASLFISVLKRYNEIKVINNREIAMSYRLIYSFYNDKLLLVLSLLFALLSIYFFTLSLIPYRVELLIFIPFLIILFCFDFYLCIVKDKYDENIFFDQGILLYRLFLMMLFIILMLVDIPVFYS